MRVRQPVICAWWAAVHLFAFSESCFICSWSLPFRVRRSVISKVLALSSEVLIAHIAGFLFWYASPIAANILYDAKVGFPFLWFAEVGLRRLLGQIVLCSV